MLPQSASALPKRLGGLSLAICLASSLFLSPSQPASASISKPNVSYASDKIKESIVKIYTVANQFDYQQPWNSSTSQFSGSGSIISGNRILTNAHVIANNTFLEVKRYGQTKRYQASIESVSHDADLAILKIDSDEFFEGSVPLELGDLPNTQQEVVVYGFPRGGDTLSVTKGVVSRIEHQRYAHSSEYMLSVQIDAAINPGNSGGPVLADGKIAGVVMQGLSGADNIGYMVPTTVVKHFFDDMKDGKYDGFPDLGIVIQEMENPSAREKYNYTENQTGVLINKVLFNSPANGLLKPGDILTHVGPHKLANDGTVEFRPKEYTSFSYYVDQHQINDTLELGLIRDSKPLKIDFKLTTTSKDFWLVQREQYDKYPRFFIYGGFVFTPLNKNYLSAGYSSFYNAGSDLSKLLYEWPQEDKDEVVIVSQVLAADFNKGYHHLSDWSIESVNGKSFRNFNEFYELMTQADASFINLKNSQGYEVVINRETATKNSKMLLERYHIAASHSKDLKPIGMQTSTKNQTVSQANPSKEGQLQNNKPAATTAPKSNSTILMRH